MKTATLRDIIIDLLDRGTTLIAAMSSGFFFRPTLPVFLDSVSAAAPLWMPNFARAQKREIVLTLTPAKADPF